MQPGTTNDTKPEKRTRKSTSKVDTLCRRRPNLEFSGVGWAGWVGGRASYFPHEYLGPQETHCHNGQVRAAKRTRDIRAPLGSAHARNRLIPFLQGLNSKRSSNLPLPPPVYATVRVNFISVFRESKQRRLTGVSSPVSPPPPPPPPPSRSCPTRPAVPATAGPPAPCALRRSPP